MASRTLLERSGVSSGVVIGNLLVFFLGDFFFRLVPVVILPDSSDIIIDLSFLYSFDPNFQFLSGDKAISITANSVISFPQPLLALVVWA